MYSQYSELAEWDGATTFSFTPSSDTWVLDFEMWKAQTQ